MKEQPFDTFGTNSCVKISDHTYFSPDHLGGTAMTLRHMKIFVAVYQQKASPSHRTACIWLSRPSAWRSRSWRNIIISACSTASPDGFTRRKTGIASMNMHSISCHFFQKWKIKFPPGMQMPRSILAPASLSAPACSPPLSKSIRNSTRKSKSM